MKNLCDFRSYVICIEIRYRIVAIKVDMMKIQTKGKEERSG